MAKKRNSASNKMQELARQKNAPAQTIAPTIESEPAVEAPMKAEASPTLKVQNEFDESRGMVFQTSPSLRNLIPGFREIMQFVDIAEMGYSPPVLLQRGLIFPFNSTQNG